MTIMSAKDIASELGTDPKRFRRFVRAHMRALGGTVGVDTPGQGGRYAFDSSELDAIRDAFNAWSLTRNALLISFALDVDDASDDA
jgi:hypothetical protein